MIWKLFIDDERYPVTNDWVIARSSAQAIQECLTHGVLPQEIAFDHDLGGEDTSMGFIQWLIDAVYDLGYVFPSNFVYTVHSQNPIGAEKIKGYMDNLLREFIK